MTRYEDHEDEWRGEDNERHEYNRRSHIVCCICGGTLTHHACWCPEGGGEEESEDFS